LYAIVRQTTVLIAQLSTAAGVRAPLSRVADQVFLDLAREIEAQGVSRKVAADMFGLALRTYQTKVQRLARSSTERDRTLWEGILAFVAEHGPVSRKKLLFFDCIETGLVSLNSRSQLGESALTLNETLVVAPRDALKAESPFPEPFPFPL